VNIGEDKAGMWGCAREKRREKTMRGKAGLGERVGQGSF
jgi:hypothetical protein